MKHGVRIREASRIEILCVEVASYVYSMQDYAEAKETLYAGHTPINVEDAHCSVRSEHLRIEVHRMPSSRTTVPQSLPSARAKGHLEEAQHESTDLHSDWK